MTKFEFIVDGPPVSQQTRRRERLRAWKIVVRQEAEKYWPPEQKAATGLIMLQITYFYDSGQQKISSKVEASHQKREQSKQLLEIAKTGVERAMKTDEVTAMI